MVKVTRLTHFGHAAPQTHRETNALIPLASERTGVPIWSSGAYARSSCALLRAVANDSVALQVHPQAIGDRRNLFRPSAIQRHDRTKWLSLIALPIGTEVGFSSAGAGALGALSLLSMTELSPAAVVGTDLVFGLVLSLIGGGVNAALGTLNRGVLLQLLIGGVPGAILGAYLAGKVPSKQLRMGLSVAMALLGASLFYKAFF